MAQVVFMRGVNVGGHKAFRPAAFAKQLAALDVANVGAAGTFVVGAAIGQAALRAELLRRLPFEAELMICRGADLAKLIAGDPFRRQAAPEDARRFVSVMAKRPRTLPRFPVNRPEGADWQVRLVGLRGRFVLSLWRKTGKTMIYPNEVVEKRLGVAATTRTWATLVKIHDLLAAR